MNENVVPVEFVPVAEATVAARISREKMIRRIQSGLLEGKFEGGRWLVARRELDAIARQRQSAAKG